MVSGNDFDIVEVRKALFTSPGANVNDSSDVTASSLNSRLQIEHDTDDHYKRSQKDAHEKRMKKFRRWAKEIEEDDWIYPPIEKLIGLK